MIIFFRGMKGYLLSGVYHRLELFTDKSFTVKLSLIFIQGVTNNAKVSINII